MKTMETAIAGLGCLLMPTVVVSPGHASLQRSEESGKWLRSLYRCRRRLSPASLLFSPVHLLGGRKRNWMQEHTDRCCHCMSTPSGTRILLQQHTSPMDSHLERTSWLRGCHPVGISSLQHTRLNRHCSRRKMPGIAHFHSSAAMKQQRWLLFYLRVESVVAVLPSPDNFWMSLAARRSGVFPIVDSQLRPAHSALQSSSLESHTVHTAAAPPLHEGKKKC